MARIPREFTKVEPGVYKYKGYHIRKEGVTTQDGTMVATYIATDAEGKVVDTKKSAQAIFESLAGKQDK